MEIFTNFCNLLTTENEFITKLFTIPTIPIEVYLSFFIIITVLKIDFTKKQKYLYLLVFSLISLATKFLIPSPYNIIINYLLMFIAAKIIFKTNVIKAILTVIIPTIVFALVSTILLNPLLKALNITSNNLNKIALYQLIYMMLLYLLTFVLTLLLKHTKINFYLTDDLDKHSRRIILSNLCLGLITLCTQALLTYYYVNILPLYITLLNFILLFCYFSVSLYSLSRLVKLQITTKDLENAESYNTTLSYLYDNVRAFKHDFDNMVFVIGGFIENNDMNKLATYYKNLQKDCEKVNELSLLNPKLINNSGIYNLLMSKYKKAKDNNIEIHLEYFFDLEKLKIPIYDFSRMLGILLDNALEAAKDSEEKQINILFRDSQMNNTQIISIENSYSNKDVDTSSIFEKGNTSKENHTGMGLWEVKQILNRNNNVNLNTTKDEKCFKQTIEIYY